MRFGKIRFKGKKRVGKGKTSGSGTEGVPLIELHRYSRLPESQPDEECEWHAARALDLNTPSRPSPKTKKVKRRTKILNLIFPARLGELATAWRLQIETANGTRIPVSTAGDIVMPRAVYSVGRSRQRGWGRSKVHGSSEGNVGGTGSVNAKGKGKVRFVFAKDDVREVPDLGNGEGSSQTVGRSGFGSGSGGVSQMKRNSDRENGKVAVIKGWVTAAEFGMFL